MTMTEPADADYSASVRGRFYVSFLTDVHAALRPANYLEIGTAKGQTLALSKAASIAVDPRFKIDANVVGSKPLCLFFQMTSDDFFAEHSPRALFGAPIDMAFLDGMHRFEFLLRDVINTEKHCAQNSAVFLHDCLPPGLMMTVRDLSDPRRAQSRFKDWWAGDVWKVVPTLKKWRPDLSVTVIDCAPTGLVALTGLDPTSTALQDHYDEIIASFEADLNRREFDRFWAEVEVTPAAALESEAAIRAQFNRSAL